MRNDGIAARWDPPTPRIRHEPWVRRVGRPGDADRAAPSRSRGARRAARGPARATRSRRARARGSARDPGRAHAARAARAPRLGAGRRVPARPGRTGQRRFLPRRRGAAGLHPAGHRRRRRARPAGRAARGVRADDVRRDRALLRRPLAAAELGQHGAGGAGRHEHRVRHRRLPDVPPPRADAALGIRRPSARAMDARRPELAAPSRGRRSASRRLPTTPRDRFDCRAPRGCCSTPTD